MYLRRFGVADHVGKRLLKNAKQSQTNFLRQDLAVVRQGKMDTEIRVLFQNVIGMRANGVLQTEIKYSRRAEFLGSRTQVLQDVLDVLLHVPQCFLQFRSCASIAA